MYTPLPVESIEPSSFIPSPLERDRIRTAGARALLYLIPAQAAIPPRTDVGPCRVASVPIAFTRTWYEWDGEAHT
jgi:hypothetical protein